jgi:hypothetical protein
MLIGTRSASTKDVEKIKMDLQEVGWGMDWIELA